MPRPRSDRRASWPALVLALVLPVLYVLSSGPTFWLIERYARGSWVRRWAMFFYQPLEWLADLCPPFRDAIGWYVCLFVSD